jgi:hypothetical protein
MVSTGHYRTAFHNQHAEIAPRYCNVPWRQEWRRLKARPGRAVAADCPQSRGRVFAGCVVAACKGSEFAAYAKQAVQLRCALVHGFFKMTVDSPGATQAPLREAPARRASENASPGPRAPTR